jgi:hypothetical protein
VRVDTMNSIDFVGPKAAHTTRKNIVWLKTFQDDIFF